MTTEPPRLSLAGLTRRVPGFTLDRLDLDLARGEYFVLLGPTGSGKTLLLDCLCGLTRPTSGRVLLDGVDVTRWDPARRRLGYVPQDGALLPFQTVRQNIAFGLRARRLPTDEIDRRVGAMLDLLDIGGLGGRYPAELSGGERQRVALGRALVIQPQVLLLDEPLSAIDEDLREQLVRELRALHERLGTTTLHICHSLEEGLGLADRLGLLRAGQLVQVGTPDELVTAPRDLFTARFLRLPNLLGGQVAGGRFTAGDLTLDSDLPDGPAAALLPPTQLTLAREAPAEAPDRLTLVAHVAPARGRSLRPELRLDGPGELTVPGLFAPDDWPAGLPVWLSCPRDAVRLLPSPQTLARADHTRRYRVR